jgi:hypothetical protein
LRTTQALSIEQGQEGRKEEGSYGEREEQSEMTTMYRLRAFSALRGITFENLAAPAPEPASPPPRLFTAPEITQWSQTWPGAKYLNSAWPAMVSIARVGRDSGLYLQRGTFDPLDPRLFAAHMWRPGYDKPPSRAFTMLERELVKEGKAHHRIVEPPADRKGKSKPVWSLPWERKQMAWSDLWSGRADAGPTVWQDGKRGACWGMSKADMRRIADAINGAVDRGRGQVVVNDQLIELKKYQVVPPGVTQYRLNKAVAKAEANGSTEAFEDALTNLWRIARRRRRPQRRVRIEPWVDHPYGGHSNGFTVATERGLREQVRPAGVEYGRSNIEEATGAITESYWPTDCSGGAGTGRACLLSILPFGSANIPSFASLAACLGARVSSSRCLRSIHRPPSPASPDF